LELGQQQHNRKVRRAREEKRKEKRICYVRDRSCLLRCSLLLKARAQNWHLYFLSGCVVDVFRGVGVDAADAAGTTATLAAGMMRWVPGCLGMSVARLSGIAYRKRIVEMVASLPLSSSLQVSLVGAVLDSTFGLATTTDASLLSRNALDLDS
jgi:hypothetical protein